MKMPPPNRWAKPTGRFLFYIWDTKDVPFEQVIDEHTVVITPQFDNLHVYGREMQEEPDEHRDGILFGEWFSTACPEGELGTVNVRECRYISAEAFSDAYQRGWRLKGEE